LAEISPKNWEYSSIKLTNGSSLILGESQDVSDQNEGMIVFEKGTPIYIPWDKIEKITF
jgi:sporulation protein YlmC with PRC-barrel domain